LHLADIDPRRPDGWPKNYRITCFDVDGNTLSTADGRITTVVLTTQSGIDKARLVGDRTPDFCVGNPAFRMITVLAFEKKHSKPIQLLMSAIMRRRRDAEGRRLQARYDKLKLRAMSAATFFACQISTVR
jgi:hypothetical protein